MTIIGRQTMDGECDVTELTVPGQMLPLPDGWELRYQQEDETGVVTSRVRVTDGQLEVERRGAVSSTLRLTVGQRQESDYDTGYGWLRMGLETEFLACDLTPAGGRVEAHYTMDINGTVMADHVLTMEIKGAETICQK